MEFEISINNLPDWLVQALREGGQRVMAVSDMRNDVKRKAYGDTINIYNDATLRSTGDYSMTTFAFYNFKTGKKIPLRNIISDLPRARKNRKQTNKNNQQEWNVYEDNGWYSFMGLGDSYNLEHGTYAEKLARGGVQFNLKRDEICISYNTEYRWKYARIETHPLSPMFNMYDPLNEFSEITLADYIALAMFKKHDESGRYPLTKAFKQHLGNWELSNPVIKLLLKKSYISTKMNPNFPHITSQGRADLENMTRYIKDETEIRWVYDDFNRFGEYINQLKSKNIKITDSITGGKL